MKVVDQKDFTPICPHCEKKLREVIRVSDRKLIGRKGFCYACLHCGKVLGFADWSP